MHPQPSDDAAADVDTLLKTPLRCAIIRTIEHFLMTTGGENAGLENAGMDLNGPKMQVVENVGMTKCRH